VSGSSSNVVLSSLIVNPSITLPRYHIDQIAYAQEYYKAIDPADARSTLAGFKATNGFGTTCNPDGITEFEVGFRDVKDLGYGRHMCWRGSTTAAGNIAIWVENFQVSATSDHYSRLNLEALVNNDRRWHVGTNAIEYGAGPGGGSRFLKFYTYNPDGTRRTVVDLDGRGAKAMPVPCISCHGGRANPLLETATAVAGGGGVTSRFPTIPDSPRGSTLARMQPLNVDTFDFWTSAPYRRIDQEATLKAINRLVLCTYPLVLPNAGTEDNCRTAVANSEWQGTNAAMIKAWYGGDGIPDPTQSDTFIPGTPGVEWAAGAEQNIYRTVVAPNCRVCHSLRGNANQSDIDFTSYAKFSGYVDRIKYHVFDKGNMPLALLKFNLFWESDAPAILAAIVPGSTIGGSVLSPNRPVAKTGPDRVVLPGTTKLSAAASTNASSYNWSTVAPCSFAVGESTKIRPTLTTGATGTSCTVDLVVSNGTTSSTPATLLVVASSTAPSGTRFNNVAADIVPSILRGPPGCNGCHTTSGAPNFGIAAIPLYYAANVDYDGDGTIDPGDGSVDPGDVHQLYLNVRGRINFTDIEGSPLLRKPSGNHHCGGTPLPNTGLPGDAGRALYDKLLNWILDGAPE
jgi:mono/diheme cytochrome c family protein